MKNQILKEKINFFDEFLKNIGTKEKNCICINENHYKKIQYNGQLNEFLESLQNSTNLITDKAVKNVINSDSENSDTGSDKLTISKNHKPSKTLKLEKSIIKSDSDSDSE